MPVIAFRKWHQHLEKFKAVFSSIRSLSISSYDNYDLESIQAELRLPHPFKNVTETILAKVGRNLHLQPDHPLCLTKQIIERYCNDYAKRQRQSSFELYDNLCPIVSTVACFDDLRVASDHVSRSQSDTYYLTDSKVLRTHTSAHQVELLKRGERERKKERERERETAFLCSGDVYRRDEIDSTHYPVFHQIEGVRVFDPSLSLSLSLTQAEMARMAEEDLKQLLSGLATHLFGPDTEIRWREDYFPFTSPSYELDVKYRGEWVEVLGCGLIHDDVLRCAGLRERERGREKDGEREREKVAWAFGLGLERLSMVLFSIPDIRLFWSEDRRFLDQFSSLSLSLSSASPLSFSRISFVPYSKYPECYKDVSFWLPDKEREREREREREFHSNDVYEIIRSVAGDMVEKVSLSSSFTHPLSLRVSHCYRISYRHMDRSLTNDEVNAVQERVREQLAAELSVELR